MLPVFRTLNNRVIRISTRSAFDRTYLDPLDTLDPISEKTFMTSIVYTAIRLRYRQHQVASHPVVVQLGERKVRQY